MNQVIETFLNLQLREFQEFAVYLKILKVKLFFFNEFLKIVNPRSMKGFKILNSLLKSNIMKSMSFYKRNFSMNEFSNIQFSLYSTFQSAALCDTTSGPFQTCFRAVNLGALFRPMTFHKDSSISRSSVHTWIAMSKSIW